MIYYRDNTWTRTPPAALRADYDNAIAPGLIALAENPDSHLGDQGAAYISAVRWACLARHRDAPKLDKNAIRDRIRRCNAGEAAAVFAEQVASFTALEAAATDRRFTIYAPPVFDPE
jgi:hypothetical protein